MWLLPLDAELALCDKTCVRILLCENSAKSVFKTDCSKTDSCKTDFRRTDVASMVHGASMAHGPWPIHGAWCMVDPWPMVLHLQSMVQGEDATMLRLSGEIFCNVF